MSSDPTLLRDDRSNASRRLRLLLVAAAADLPGDAELARLASKLGPLLLPPVAGAAAGTAVGAGLGTTAKLSLAAAVLAGGGLLAYYAATHGGAPAPTPPAPTVAAPTAAPPEPARPSAPVEAPPVVESAPSPSAAPSATAPAPGSDAAAKQPSSGSTHPATTEAVLLEGARSVLGSNPARALQLTDEHRARFPSGVLAQEREVIAIEALKRLGRADAAARRVEAFARRYPGSAYLKKLDAGP
jgi:hypothetical protein